ncbi:hypothetical protein HGA91_03480 [candidate division WWE3 bacterium]|nr:hypothetical protein [candidate division WWE3 bacterium]
MLNSLLEFNQTPIIVGITILLLSTFIHSILAIPIIHTLYHYKFYKTKSTEGIDVSKRNPLWYDHFGKRLDTPSSFGVVLFILLIMFLSISVKYESAITVWIFGGAIFFGILGLLDDCIKYYWYLIYKDWGLSIKHKLLMQAVGISLFIYLINGSTNVITSILIVVMLLFFINAYNITDGLDGLIGWVSLMVLPVLAYAEWQTAKDWILLYFYVSMMGFFIVFLYFNIKPARVLLGDVGTMTIGFVMSIALIRYPIWPIIIAYSLILTEGLSSLLQIVSIKLFKRKILLIAPLHLHLLNKNWEDTKIVQRALLAQIILSLIAIVYLT